MCARLRFPLQIAAAFALACADGPPPLSAPLPGPAPDLIATTFEGQVEVADGAARDSVIVSTATEEVVVAPGAAADSLKALEGRTVTLHGWVVDEPQDALVMVVTSYEVAGEQHSRTELR